MTSPNLVIRAPEPPPPPLPDRVIRLIYKRKWYITFITLPNTLKKNEFLNGWDILVKSTIALAMK